MIKWLKRRVIGAILIVAVILLFILWNTTPAELRGVILLAILGLVAARAAHRNWINKTGWGSFTFVAIVGFFAVGVTRIGFAWLPLIVPTAAWIVTSVWYLKPAVDSDLRNLNVEKQFAGDVDSVNVIKILRKPKKLNPILFTVGLRAQKLSFFASLRRTRQKIDPTDPAKAASTLSATGLQLLGSRSRSGRITVGGTEHLVPVLRRIEASPVGPRAIISTLPGATVNTYRAVSETLATEFRVPRINISELPEDRARGEVRLEFALKDPLAMKISANDFLQQHPATTPLLIPCAYDETRSVYEIGIHHTLIVGATGSGKGSALWAIMRQLISMQEQGLVKLYGADPKRAELKGFEKTSVFERVEFDIEGIAEMVGDLLTDLKAAQIESGRTFQLSKATPLHVLVADEFSSITGDPSYRGDFEANLNAYMSQGRSDGNYVIAAAQAGQKEELGKIRRHFGNKILLRMENAGEVDMLMGKGARDAGAEADLIPIASEGNGYASAGIGFVRRDDEPRPVKVRFPYTSDEDIKQLIRDHPLAGTGTGQTERKKLTRTDAAPERKKSRRRPGASLADLTGL